MASGANPNPPSILLWDPHRLRGWDYDGWVVREVAFNSPLRSSCSCWQSWQGGRISLLQFSFEILSNLTTSVAMARDTILPSILLWDPRTRFTSMTTGQFTCLQFSFEILCSLARRMVYPAGHCPFNSPLRSSWFVKANGSLYDEVLLAFNSPLRSSPSEFGLTNTTLETKPTFNSPLRSSTLVTSSTHSGSAPPSILLWDPHQFF